MMKPIYKIGLAVAALILAVLLWRGDSPAESDKTASEDVSGRPMTGTNTDQIGETIKNREWRSSTRQRTGRDGGTDLENDDYPEIDLEEANSLIESGDVVEMELRGYGGRLIEPKEPLAAVLKLREGEADAINEMWAELLPKLNKLRAEHVKTQTMEDGEVWVGVEMFVEQGDELRQGFISQIHDLVGEQRGGLFLQGIQAHAAYGRWGKTVGSGFSIRVKEQDDGSYLYEITEQAQGDSKAARQWKSNRVPSHLKVLAEAALIELEP